MMGFSGAVQWWEEWQLRVLVLASLFLQFFLFVAAPLRKRCIPGWFRFVIWLAYLGSDAVAIYALASCSLQPTQEGGVGIRAPRERQHGGTVGAHLAGAPRRPGRDRCLQHRRQRAMDTACPNSSVSS